MGMREVLVAVQRKKPFTPYAQDGDSAKWRRAARRRSARAVLVSTAGSARATRPLRVVGMMKAGSWTILDSQCGKCCFELAELDGNVGTAHADTTEQVGEEDEALGLVRDAGQVVLGETRELDSTHGDGLATSAGGGRGCGSHGGWLGDGWLGDGRRRVGGGRRVRRAGKGGLARTGERCMGRRLGRKTDADGKELASSQEDNVVFVLGLCWRHNHEVDIVKRW